MAQIPDRIICQAQVEGKPVEGVLVIARFGVVHKNPYSIVFGPTDQEGIAVITKPEILKQAQEELKIALMDFTPLEGAFNGTITLKMMSKEDIENAIKAYNIYKGFSKFPIGYEHLLKNALEKDVLSKISQVVLKQLI